MKNYISKAGKPGQIVPRNGAIDKPTDMLNQLLTRDDKVSIEGGKLVVVPASGKPVPSDWFDANEPVIVEQIAAQTGVIILRYAEYSTGVYSDSAHSFPGVTLQFDCVTTLADAYAIFNCILTRARTTKHGTAKSPLPKKHFRLSRKHQLTKFLKRSGIQPRSLSEAYKSMHKLKGLLFNATYVPNKDNRLQSDSLTPLNLPYQHLLKLLETAAKQSGTSALQVAKQSGSSAVKCRDKETADNHTQSDFPPISTTGVFNHGKRTALPREYGTRVTTTPLISTPNEHSEGKVKEVDPYAQREGESFDEWWTCTK